MSRNSGRRGNGRLYEFPGDLLRALVQTGVSEPGSINFMLDTLVSLPAVQEAAIERYRNRTSRRKPKSSQVKNPISSGAQVEELFPEITLEESDDETSDDQVKVETRIPHASDEELFPEITMDSASEEESPPLPSTGLDESSRKMLVAQGVTSRICSEEGNIFLKVRFPRRTRTHALVPC